MEVVPVPASPPLASGLAHPIKLDALDSPAVSASTPTKIAPTLHSVPLVIVPPPVPANPTPPLRNGTIIKGVRGRRQPIATTKPAPSYKLRERSRPSQGKWYFIVNGTKLAQWDQLSPRLLNQLQGVEWRVHVTRSKGHARSLAERAALAGADLIAAVGGDGTLNEVVDGIMRAGILGPDGLPRATVTVLPLGTASDFHRSMAWTPNDFEEAMWRIGNRGETAVLDVGRIVCESRSGPVVRHFINVASCGASARAAMRLHKWKWLGECARYRLAAFAALFKYKRRTVGVRIDGGDWRRVRDASLIAVGNGAYFGHGLNICPDANPYDGKLQVVTASGMGPLAFLMQAWRLRMGRHLDQHGITAEDATHRVDVALWSQRSFLPEINYQPLPLAGSNPTHSPSAMSLDTLSSSSPGTVGVSTPAGSFTAQERPPRVASAPSSPATTVQQDPSETASNGSGPCSAPSGATGGASQAGRRDGDDAEREECDDSESGESTTSWPRARRGRREKIAAQPPSPASSLSARTHCTEVRSEHRQAAIQRNLRYNKASKASKSDANIQKVDLNPEDYGPVPVEVDGEVIGHAPFCITLLPGAIKVRVQGVNLK